jgi:hypothetical protein
VGGVVLLIAGIVSGGTNSTHTSSASQHAQNTPTQTQPQPAPPKPVSLAVTTPSNGTTVRAPSVVVAGTTEPGAKVFVGDKAVHVDSGGAWKTTVQLHVGANRISIGADHPPGTSSAIDLTITRQLTRAEKAQIAAAQRKAAAQRAAAQRRRAAAQAQRAAAARQAFINGAKTIPYNQLIKNPEQYAGTPVAYHGQIFQVQESGGMGVVLLSVTDEGYGMWTDNICVNYFQHIKSAKNDIITVYGKVVGMKTYTSQAGYDISIPEIDAKYIVERG